MTLKELYARIARLKICQQAKEALHRLAEELPRLVEKILNFIRRHRQFSEALLLGAVVAYLLTLIPLIGNFFALVALVTAGAVGLARELQAQLHQTFGGATA